MDNLICTECRTTYYSAAADTMIARGERCDCGGVLRTVDEAEVPVGRAATPQGNGVAPPAGRHPSGRGRFARD